MRFLTSSSGVMTVPMWFSKGGLKEVKEAWEDGMKEPNFEGLILRYEGDPKSYKIKDISAKNMANLLIEEDKKRLKKYRRYEIKGTSIFKGERTATRKHKLLLEHFKRTPYELLNPREKLYLRFKTQHLHFTRYKHPHPAIQQLKSELTTDSRIKNMENSANDELLPIHYELFQGEEIKGELKQ